MDKLNKYSKKIIGYIDNNFKDVKVDLKDITKFKIIQKISEQVNICDKKIAERDIKTEKYDLFKIHEIDQYPLIFVLFDYLVSNGMAFDGINKTDFNFGKFIIWYRENQHSINNKTLLDKILNTNNTDLINMYSLLFNVEGPRELLHNILYNNSFVSLDVQHHAETSDMTLTTYKEKDKTEINVYNIENKHQINIELLFNICEIMYNLAQHYGSKIKEYPRVTIFAGLQKKLFTTYDTKLCSDNINSGSTMTGKSISIWRYEEVYKVLTHELIHYYELDFYIMAKNYDKIESFVNNTFCLEGFDRPNESYTETLAVVINSMIVSHITKVNFSKIFNYEIIFSLFQVSKILNYFGFNNMEELFDADKCIAKINQRTSVISYFIVKTSLLLEIDTFLKFLDDNNVIITDKVVDYMKLIKTTISNKTYHNLVNSIKNIKENSNTNSNFVKETLRMTCCQIN